MSAASERLLTMQQVFVEKQAEDGVTLGYSAIVGEP